MGSENFFESIVYKEPNELAKRFNALFRNRGWVYYTSFSPQVAKSVIDEVKAKGCDAAEQMLVNYYTVENINWQIHRFKQVKNFRNRIWLLRKVVDDYEAERYYACVPVILAILDGIFSENNNGQAFFSEKGSSNLEVESIKSINARSLKKLHRKLNKSRRKVNSALISIPYRHGIIHGLDLTYDTKLVAAKSWAALFLVCDWVLEVKQQKDKKLTETTQSESFGVQVDSLLRLKQEHNELTERLSAWKPRKLIIGIDIPETGEPADFLTGTPEYALARFLNYWKKRNYGKMAEMFRIISSKHASVSPGELREKYKDMQLITFALKSVNDKNIFQTTIHVRLTYEKNQTIKNKTVEYILLNIDKNGKIKDRSKKESYWKIMDLNDTFL